ncbi:MAG: hypothetical protein CNCCGFBP_01885 [Fimbriimonadaceae bacterium]|nr:hypothetical protein [Fimbriimonadaceae bacterium]
MDGHFAADPAHRARAHAPPLDRFERGLPNLGVIGEPQVVVAGKVDDLFAVHPHPAACRSFEHARLLVEVLIFEVLEVGGEPGLERRVHGPL